MVVAAKHKTFLWFISLIDVLSKQIKIRLYGEGMQVVKAG